ncbi:integrator complex subunit 5 isoform X1 [Photinus pyralis]|nr:integrator complex subunit 5 isoform X1 [Photinus pyralis]XP_031350419.1 integrator complex subunit 5 isoform X1 [Photinus pyralis]
MSPTIRNVQQPDVLLELKSFIGGATHSTKPNHFELTKAALNLLKTLPAARDAVLEYFCTVFNVATQNFIVRIETEIATGQLPPATEDDEAIISEIHGVICNFVSSNAEAWAPIISTWSLELLGELSTRYAGRAHVSTSVNETLQLWMSCRATRTLIDITTQCLSSHIHSDTEACINALLDTSVKHSPNFDWVVAHVGSCFPTTVITRVLSCGLKDFCQNKSYEQGSQSPKLKSVVGILGHLAGSHCEDIHTALLDLFNWSLKPLSPGDQEDCKLQKKATVPFLLQLAYLSPTILVAISKDICETLTLSAVTQLCRFIDDWCKYFGSPDALKEIIINLIIKCEIGGVQIINIFLDCILIENVSIANTMKNSIQKCAQEMLEHLLQEIDSLVRAQSQHPNTVINILDSFIREVAELDEILTSTQLKASTAAKIITFIGHNNPSVLVKSCAHLFKNATTSEHLASLVYILTNELLDKTRDPYCEKGGHFAVILHQVVTQAEEMPDGSKEEAYLQLIKNLLILLRWEKSEQFPLLHSNVIWRAVHFNIINLTKLFGSKDYNLEVQHAVAELLDFLRLPSLDGINSYPIPLQAVLNLTSGAVRYFFRCCSESDVKKFLGLGRIKNVLKRVVLHSKAAKMLALRELLEGALFSDTKMLFGAKAESSLKPDDFEKLLIEQNRKNSKSIVLTKNSSVLHGGVIGNGRKKSISSAELSKEAISDNTEQFLRTLKACCTVPVGDDDTAGVDVSVDSLTSVSLLLVQFVSPDVMYNGLPWPEEEFCKVTIERDFYIRRLFNDTPLLWDLLTFVAMYRPTLCYCSVLLRAITATLIHQWNSIGDQTHLVDPSKYKAMLDTTTKVLDVMALGQLLPPPLSSIRDVIPYVKCSEIVQILRDCVWNYMRDNVPSPALFNCDSSGMVWRDPTTARPPEIYTTTLRIIMQQNIETVGHLYCHMFIKIPSNE